MYWGYHPSQIRILGDRLSLVLDLVNKFRPNLVRGCNGLWCLQFAVDVLLVGVEYKCK